MADTYEVWTRCGNCGDLSHELIPKGTEADKILSDKICKRCDCKTLSSAGLRWLVESKES